MEVGAIYRVGVVLFVGIFILSGIERDEILVGILLGIGGLMGFLILGVLFELIFSERVASILSVVLMVALAIGAATQNTSWLSGGSTCIDVGRYGVGQRCF